MSRFPTAAAQPQFPICIPPVFFVPSLQRADILGLRSTRRMGPIARSSLGELRKAGRRMPRH